MTDKFKKPDKLKINHEHQLKRRAEDPEGHKYDLPDAHQLYDHPASEFSLQNDGRVRIQGPIEDKLVRAAVSLTSSAAASVGIVKTIHRRGKRLKPNPT